MSDKSSLIVVDFAQTEVLNCVKIYTVLIMNHSCKGFWLFDGMNKPLSSSAEKYFAFSYEYLLNNILRIL